MSALGDHLRTLREQRLLSQEALAERTGLSARTVRALENGSVARPRLSTLALLASGLDLGADEVGALQRLALAGAGVTVGAPAADTLESEPAVGDAAQPAPTAVAGPEPAEPSPLAVARMLPRDVSSFVGRSTELARLGELLAGPHASAGVPVVVVSGPPGVGKTALAVHWAHSRAVDFPDGQLFMRLNGGGPRPLEPADALGQLLRALGVHPSAVPSSVEERSARLRMLLAGRRFLMVLDDARDAAQVTPLLAGEPGTAILLTSRRRLAGLEAVESLELSVLDPLSALEMLGRLAGARRVATQRPDAQRIVEHCGLMPLAITIAGARLAARQHWTVARLANRLDGEHRRLDELAVGDAGVRASIALSYQALSSPQRRAFRLLGLLDQPDFPSWPAAALLDVDPATADLVVEDLVDAHLIEPMHEDGAGQLRYRFHDLLRAFARERAYAEESDTERIAALRRTLEGLLRLAEQADAGLPSPTLGRRPGSGEPPRRLGPPGRRTEADPASPVAWFEAERPALVASVGQAVRLGAADLAWALAHASLGFLAHRSYLDEWAEMHEAALEACRVDANVAGQAYLTRGLGQLAIERDALADARAWFDRSRSLFDRVDDDNGRAYTLMGLGAVAHLGAAHAEAGQLLGRALALMNSTGDRRGAAHVHRDIGLVERELGHYTEAAAQLQEALDGFRATGDRRFAAICLRSRGLLHKKRGNLSAARDDLAAARDQLRLVDDPQALLYATIDFAELLDDRTVGRSLLVDALHSAEQAGNSFMAASAWRKLGNSYAADGQDEAAERHLLRAAAIWRRLAMPLYQGRCLSEVAATRAAAGRLSDAVQAWERASALLQPLGVPEAAEVARRLDRARLTAAALGINRETG